VTADVASDFAAAGGVSDVNCVLEVQCFGKGREIIGVGVQVVALPRLAGAAVTATVGADAPVAVRRKEEHRVFPCIGRERPPVAENDGLAVSPVLVVNLRSVFRRNAGHGSSFLSVRGVNEISSLCFGPRRRQSKGAEESCAAPKERAAGTYAKSA